VFSKNSEKLESFVGAGSRFKGDVETKGTIRIDGIVEGNLRADWVVLGEKALVRGNIEARGVVVGGSVDGNLKAKDLLEIKTKGVVLGDVVAGKLAVLEGGMLHGRISMQVDGSKVVEFQTKGGT
jgi:cytoskeletal protein CcmA (bactofilin family)